MTALELIAILEEYEDECEIQFVYVDSRGREWHYHFDREDFGSLEARRDDEVYVRIWEEPQSE